MNPSTKQGLEWNSSKSTNKDAITRRFAQSMFECAEYLQHFNSKAAVLKDLKENSLDGKGMPDSDKLIKYFRSKIKTGFSVALTCDFLKEFDKYFEFLCKPDVHIKDVFIAFKGGRRISGAPIWAITAPSTYSTMEWTML